MSVKEKNQVYRCSVCGNIVEVLHVGGGILVCCGKEMELLDGNTVDASLEKHVPVIEKTATGYKVTIGSVMHPMEEAHFIEWIEIIADGISYKQFLRPGDQPVAEFTTNAATITAKEYCNLHGLWKS